MCTIVNRLLCLGGYVCRSLPFAFIILPVALLASVFAATTALLLPLGLLLGWL